MFLYIILKYILTSVFLLLLFLITIAHIGNFAFYVCQSFGHRPACQKLLAAILKMKATILDSNRYSHCFDRMLK